MTDRTCEATTFEETAALLGEGFKVARARMHGNRVVVEFFDPDGSGEEALQAHRTTGLPTDTQTFEINLRRAKAIIFGARNGGGMSRNDSVGEQANGRQPH